jgi:hypothetical protein
MTTSVEECSSQNYFPSNTGKIKNGVAGVVELPIRPLYTPRETYLYFHYTHYTHRFFLMFIGKLFLVATLLHIRFKVG